MSLFIYRVFCFTVFFGGTEFLVSWWRGERYMHPRIELLDYLIELDAAFYYRLVELFNGEADGFEVGGLT